MYSTSDCMHVHRDEQEADLDLKVISSHGRFIIRLQCDPWPRAVAGSLSINFLLGMSGISPCVQPILALALSAMPNGLFNIWSPRPFFYFTHIASWVRWPFSTLQPGMDWTRSCGKGETRPALRQRGIVSADPSHDAHTTKGRDILERCRLRSRNLSRLSADWVYLMRTRQSESQVPFSARCLSAGPSCFLAADAGFSWPRARAHSALQQLWDYSGFIDLSKEPQTCWAGVQPGPRHPGSYESGSSNHSANGFHTLSECSMILLPNILKNVESVDYYKQNKQPILYATMPHNLQLYTRLVWYLEQKWSCVITLYIPVLKIIYEEWLNIVFYMIFVNICFFSI